MLELSTPVKYVKRVGERIAAGLAKRGVDTVEDLLYHIPFRYETASTRSPWPSCGGTMASVIARCAAPCFSAPAPAPSSR